MSRNNTYTSIIIAYGYALLAPVRFRASLLINFYFLFITMPGKTAKRRDRLPAPMCVHSHRRRTCATRPFGRTACDQYNNNYYLRRPKRHVVRVFHYTGGVRSCVNGPPPRHIVGIAAMYVPRNNAKGSARCVKIFRNVFNIISFWKE